MICGDIKSLWGDRKLSYSRRFLKKLSIDLIIIIIIIIIIIWFNISEVVL